MPLYIPWLTETIKKRGVRYLLHHYLGQFFEEKLTLEQLSIEIYEGKGSIKDLALDVDGLNEELDFIPFKFLDGCSIAQISVEVPWSSLAKEACKVELDGAQFVCRLKTSKDGQAHCTESTLLSKSLMTSSMQMAEDIVTTEDDDDYDSPNSSFYKSHHQNHGAYEKRNSKKDKSKQMFEGLEMFAQLIDSVLRRTKLTARNTLFQIQPQEERIKDLKKKDIGSSKENIVSTDSESAVDEDNFNESDDYIKENTKQKHNHSDLEDHLSSTYSSSDDRVVDDDLDDDFHDTSHIIANDKAKLSTSNENKDATKQSKHEDDEIGPTKKRLITSDGTVEFLIKFFRCEEIIDNNNDIDKKDKTNIESGKAGPSNRDDEKEDTNPDNNTNFSAMPETVTKLLTLEDVEMRIGGVPVSNLVGKHTIMIKFNGHKSEISIFSGSPLLAVINHEQLKQFFNVFDSCSSAKDCSMNEANVDGSTLIGNLHSCGGDSNQQMMSPEDYAKIEDQLYQSVSFKNLKNHQKVQSQLCGRRWLGKQATMDVNVVDHKSDLYNDNLDNVNSTLDGSSIYHPTNSHQDQISDQLYSSRTTSDFIEPSLDHIEAFSCELKLPGIWLCILLDGQATPPLIKPYADSVCSFQTINKYIDKHIKAPHIRCLALKVSLDISPSCTNIFLADLDISEHLKDPDFMCPIIHILKSDNTTTISGPHAGNPKNYNETCITSQKQPTTTTATTSERYKARILNNKEIMIECLTNARLTLDPTMIDRLVYGYKLFDMINSCDSRESKREARRFSQCSETINTGITKKQSTGLNQFTVQLQGNQFKLELLCPIPDLRPEAAHNSTKIRPQSFLFELSQVNLTYESDKLTVKAEEATVSLKNQPQQKDHEAVKFLHAGSSADTILLTLEPSPSRLECEFPKEANDALNSSTMFDSIYVGQATESQIPTEAFATKRKVVRLVSRPDEMESTKSRSTTNENKTEKILTPGDREHLLKYIEQTLSSTRLSINVHLPTCEVELEDKEQLDLIYNRFANDFVFWQPRSFKNKNNDPSSVNINDPVDRKISRDSVESFKDPIEIDGISENEEEENDIGLEEDDDEFPVYRREINKSPMSSATKKIGDDSYEVSNEDMYANEITCKVLVDEILITFNHQSCASAMRQEVSSENLLLAVVIDVKKKPNTIVSLVTNSLELRQDSNQVLVSNNFSMQSVLDDVISTFSLTAEIKRPTPSVKNIRLALQLNKGLLNDFKIDTYKRFWQSINVTDEPVLGYIPPKIITELHVDILNTGLMLVREGIRPALLVADELYMTSMVMDESSQPVAMLRIIAEEMSLYLKRSKRKFSVGFPNSFQNNVANNSKNYVCLIDSGVIDLDIKLAHDGRVEFGVINNVITIRACQDSLNALCKLVTSLINSHEFKASCSPKEDNDKNSSSFPDDNNDMNYDNESNEPATKFQSEKTKAGIMKYKPTERELKLLEDAMEELNVSQQDQLGSQLTNANSQPQSNSHLGGEEETNNQQQQQRESQSNSKSPSPPNQLLPEMSSSGGSSLKDGLNDENSCSDADYDTEPDDEKEDEDDYEDDEDDEEEEEEDDEVEDEDDEHKYPQQDHRSKEEYGSQMDPNDHVESTKSRTFLNNDEDDETKAKFRLSQRLNQNANHCELANLDSNHACILDQSNPRLGELFTPPLMPSSPLAGQAQNRGEALLIRSADLRSDCNDDSNDPNVMSCPKTRISQLDYDDEQSHPSEAQTGHLSSQANMEESGFFIIGDDDVGAGIMSSDNKQGDSKEPVVRMLIDNPINLIEDYFKVKRPRSVPEILATSLERYLLEEMTLIVNLFGGKDLEDNDDNEDELGEEEDQVGKHEKEAYTKHATKRTELGQKKETKRKSASGFENPVGTKSSLTRRHVESESSACSANRASMIQAGQRVVGRRHVSESQVDNFVIAGDSIDSKSVRFGEGAINLWESLELSSSDLLNSSRSRANQASTFFMSSDMKQAGGPGRETDRCIQLYLSKIKCLYELAKPTSEMPVAWRFILLIQEIEIRDRLECSDINKMLYEYTNESLPRRSVPLLTIKNVATINPIDGCEECDLRISVKPLRLNVDQDTLMFIIEFFNNFSKSLNNNNNPSTCRRNSAQTRSNIRTTTNNAVGKTSAPSSSFEPAPEAGGSGSKGSSRAINSRSKTNSESESIRSNSSSTTRRTRQTSESSIERVHSTISKSTPTTTTNSLNQPRTSSSATKNNNTNGSTKQAIYIKSFTFSPEVPIRVDYHAKHMDLQQGALAGILMGLADLDRSELIIKRIQANHGMRGIDRVLGFALNHWLQDIKKNQVPNILSGIGPIHHVIDLFKGIRDLVYMPIEQYRRDKRLVRGFQRGASSFSSSTAMAAISLMNRFISIIQCTAQIAHDIVTPPQLKALPTSCDHHYHQRQRHHRQRQQQQRGRLHHQTALHASINSNNINKNDGTRTGRHTEELCAGPSSSSPRAVGMKQSAVSNHRHHHHHHHHHQGSPKQHHPIQALNQPRNFGEGLAVGFNIIKEGFNDTAKNVAIGMQAEDVRTAVGEIVRQIPSTLLNPIISATEGAQNVLVGMRNQIAPDARREDQEKWKRRVR